MKATHLFRILAVLFSITVACLVIAADLDVAGSVFGPIYNFPNGDKVAHFVLMGTLSLLISMSVRPRRLFGTVLYSVLILGVLITLEELTQIPMSHRNFSFSDLAADYAGIILFGELGVWVRRAIVGEKTAV